MIKNKQKILRYAVTDIVIFCVLTIVAIIGINKINIKIENDTNSYEEIVSLAIDVDKPDITKQNAIYISNIKNEYGVIIQYGKEVESIAKKFNATPQTNEYIVNNNLNLIYTALKKYPKNILKRDNKYIYLILFDSFNDNNIALASKSNLNEFKIYISNNQKFERALHHEIFHILEYYIEDVEPFSFNYWDNLNPTDFEYTEDIAKLTTDYVYLNNLNIENLNNIYFVSKYSKYSEKEDRAETFAETMMLSTKSNYLKNTKNLDKKVDNILNVIKNNITKEELNCYKYMY